MWFLGYFCKMTSLSDTIPFDFPVLASNFLGMWKQAEQEQLSYMQDSAAEHRATSALMLGQLRETRILWWETQNYLQIDTLENIRYFQVQRIHLNMLRDHHQRFRVCSNSFGMLSVEIWFWKDSNQTRYLPLNT